MSQLQSLALGVRLTVTNPVSESTSAFGPGVAKLCLGVREHGSLNASAKAIRMAQLSPKRAIACLTPISPFRGSSPRRPRSSSTTWFAKSRRSGNALAHPGPEPSAQRTLPPGPARR